MINKRIWAAFLLAFIPGCLADASSLPNAGKTSLAEDMFSQLDISLETALSVCRNSVDQASQNLLYLLKDDRHERTHIMKQFQRMAAADEEEMTSNLNIEEEIELISIPDDSENESESSDYFSDLENLLQSIEKACAKFPSVLLEEPEDVLQDSRPKRSVQAAPDRILNSINIWTKKWVTNIEEDAHAFVNSCLKSKDCRTNLQKLLKGSKTIMETGTLKGFRSASSVIPQIKENDEKNIADEYNEELLKFSQEISNEEKFIGEVEIEEDYIIAEVPETFLSFAFGSKLIEKKYGLLPKRRNQFIQLASAISPAMLRVGGSGANFLTYDPERRNKSPKGGTPEALWPIILERSPAKEIVNNIELRNDVHPKQQFEFSDRFGLPCEKQLGKDFSNFTMTANDWQFVVDLTKELNWTMVFDLNQFKRDATGRWDSTNARQILHDPITKNVNIIWQLGNEPNSYKHAFNVSFTVEDAIEDYKQLLQLLVEEQSNFTLIGPDVTRPKHLQEDNDLTTDSTKFLEIFLKNFKEMDAITWHQYYMDGRTATTEDMLSPEFLRAFPPEVNKVLSIRDKYAKGKPVWITETATAWHGGARDLSDSFAGTFLWLDKLGASALQGVSAVFKQTLYGGCYSLLDEEVNPVPTYWVSLLHKRIVGREVLLPRTRLASENIRLYAHCLKKDHELYQKGAVVIFGLNVGNEIEKFRLRGHNMQESAIWIYNLSAPSNDVALKKITLNGKLLRLDPKGNLPHLIPMEITKGLLTLNPKHIVFWVLPSAKVKFC